MDRLDSIPQPWKSANTLPYKKKKEGPANTDRQATELQKARAEPRDDDDDKPESNNKITVAKRTKRILKQIHGLRSKVKLDIKFDV